ncbi:hypothetical protein PR202_gb23455 [Eleusine coracana subsp. coracana]|uniref:Elongation factor Ts, mitochondrial n=1 Tax=Eleusine coracana subsp. coracana TaxID=191504 RepID=A0AAV5FIW0_ELECO|nr:hypothetical protein PR202_gb23455 [Eleusine coracana subsp. coracana]
MAMDKMVEGRLRKYFEEVVLMEQKFVVNDSTNIKTVLNDLSKKVGCKVTIGNFIRMEVGEGIGRYSVFIHVISQSSILFIYLFYFFWCCVHMEWSVVRVVI